MSGIKLLLILVIAVLIVVLFKYVQIKRQIRNLSKQMTDLTTGKSEKMLDISLVDKDIEQLAAVLNQYNEKQRQSIASTLRHEMYLKESIANISHDLRTPLTVILGHLQLDQVVGQIVAFLDRLRQQHFKFYVRCFIGAAKGGHQHFVLGLVRVLDVVQRLFQR